MPASLASTAAPGSAPHGEARSSSLAAWPLAPATGPCADVLREFLFVRRGEQLRRLRLADIHYFETDDKNTTAVLAAERIPLRRPLHELTQELAPDGFARIHRRYLVNLRHLEGLGDEGPCALVAGAALPLSRTYRAALLACLRLA